MPGTISNNRRYAGALERIRKTRGTVNLRSSFETTIKKNRNEAVQLLQDADLSFPTFYILAPIIEKYEIISEIPPHAVSALYITTVKWGEKERASLYLNRISQLNISREPSLETLRWMIRTGSDWDGPSAGNDSYDAAIDAAVALLADNYDDPETLSGVVDLMFKRYRRGLNIYDLTWGFFHTADPGALMQIAKHLLSNNSTDVELTCRLMGFNDPGTPSGRRKLFDEYSMWLAENRPYLYSTCEYFTCTSTPYHVRHDREAKMLKREISPRDRSPIMPLTQEEYKTLLAYREQSERLPSKEDFA